MKSYNIDKHSELKIDEHVTRTLLKFYSENTINETGGIILGKFNQNYSEYLITDIYQVNSYLRKTPISFVRNTQKAQLIINDSWNKSEGAINYLGEWHTHPMMKSKPSITDINTITKITKESIGINKYVFLIIIGANNDISIGAIERNGSLKTIHAGLFNKGY